MHRSAPLTLRDYIDVISERRRLIAVVAVVFALVGFALAARQDPVYVGSSQLSVSDVSQTYALIGQSAQAQLPPAQLAAQSAEALTREAVAERVARELQPPPPRPRRGEKARPVPPVSPARVRELQRRVTARVDPQTNLVIVEARTGDAPSAARTADLFAAEGAALAAGEQRRLIARALASLRREVRSARRGVRAERPGADVQLAVALQKLTQLETVRDVSRPLELVRRAQVPDAPASPRPARDAILGGVLGLVLGILLAFGRSALDRRLKSTRDVQDALDLPVVGRLGPRLLGTAPLPSANGKPDVPDLEAIRVLRTNLDFLDLDGPLRTAVVTSALPEEGKSTVAVALAATAATRPGAKVLLLEADLRRPVLAKRLGIRPGPGLSDYLSGDATPAEVLQTVALPGGGDAGPRLVCITAGTPVPRPAELLHTDRMTELLAQLREVYDLVIVDAPPLLAVVDPLEIVPHVDGVLFCVRAGRTTADQLQAAKAALEKVPGRPTGVVVTGLTAREDETYAYASYAYAPPEPEKV